MIRVLFICHGNICRSPMAEFLFLDLIRKKGFQQDFQVASAATSREEIGNPVYPPAKKQLQSLGISCAGKTAIQVVKEDYNNYDYLIVMENYNLKNLKKIIASDPENKIHRLLDFTTSPKDIDDPWYTGDFERTGSEITEGLTAFLKFLQKQ